MVWVRFRDYVVTKFSIAVSMNTKSMQNLKLP